MAEEPYKTRHVSRATTIPIGTLGHWSASGYLRVLSQPTTSVGKARDFTLNDTVALGAARIWMEMLRKISPREAIQLGLKIAIAAEDAEYRRIGKMIAIRNPVESAAENVPILPFDVDLLVDRVCEGLGITREEAQKRHREKLERLDAQRKGQEATPRKKLGRVTAPTWAPKERPRPPRGVKLIASESFVESDSRRQEKPESRAKGGKPKVPA
jgi:hypothetical protein